MVESKIWRYSIIFTLCCIVQVDEFGITLSFWQIYLLNRQMTYAATPATTGKISILCITSQAVLDAGICIVHLLSSSSVSGSVFYILMAISFMKLIIFCIMEMRLVIGIYQSRYAQEMAANGWQGLRNHLATLHARFYAALFLAIIMVDFFFERYPLFSFPVDDLLVL